jgi:hypothetical protein
MGVMIAQTVAAHFPGRVRTLTSIISTTSAPGIGRPALLTWWRMLTTGQPRTREQAMDRAVSMSGGSARTQASPGTEIPAPREWRGNWPR